MRFIVDFYRYAILVALALTIAGFAFLVLSLNDSPDLTGEALMTAVFAGIGVVGLFGISLGLVATFISIHDRHIELVDEVRLMRECIEKRGAE